MADKISEAASAVGKKLPGGKNNKLVALLGGLLVVGLLLMFAYAVMKPRVDRWAAKTNERTDEALAKLKGASGGESAPGGAGEPFAGAA
jgi:hypothetical protein